MKTKLMATLISGAALLASCEDSGMTNSDQINSQSTASMQISLVDAPATYEAVLIDVVGLEYRTYNEDSVSAESEDSVEVEGAEGTWTTVEIDPTVYDLLELNNGTEAVLANIDIKAETLSEIRMILGSGNQLVLAGDTIDLKVPSGSESGLKIKVDEKMEAGGNYKLVLDFDVAKSIVEAGKSGKFILKPVIHANLDKTDEAPQYGSISGVVWPDSVSSVVYVINTDKDSVSTIPEDNGTFLLEMLDEASYTVVALPQEGLGYTLATQTDVNVVAGQTTELDTLQFAHN